MKRKSILIMLITVLLTILLYPGTVQAALQANGGSPASYNLETWLRNIRNMEALGGTLGLQDTINSTNLTSSASEKNNIDIHMEKNTEYGAMAILSASSYGKQNKINNGETTTGNKTGIYIYFENIGSFNDDAHTHGEWVSAGRITGSGLYTNANLKYKNFYDIPLVGKSGDAMTETIGWHGSNVSVFQDYVFASVRDNSGILRAYGGSLFSYCSFGSSHGYYNWGTDFTLVAPSRAVIVCGNGF